MKAKRLAASGPIEGPWALPDSWHWSALGSLGRWTGGGTPSKANPAYWTNGTIPWVSPKDMKRSLIDSSEDLITADAVAGSSAKLVPAGSVLCVMRSGILRHTFPVAVNTVEVTLNQDMRALTPGNGINPRFLAYYLQLTGPTVLLNASKAGTTVNSVEASRLDRHPVPLPSDPALQDRLVARIDEFFAEIDDGEAALARAREDLATWRKALLKAAVAGELTAEWRAHDGIERVSTPVCFGSVVDIRSGFAFKSMEYGLGRVPLIRIADVIGDEVRVTAENARLPDYHLKQSAAFLVEDGDILLTLSGSVGRSATYRSREPALLNQRVCRIRCSSGSGLLPAYAQLFLSAREQVIAAMGYGGSQANVSPKQIAALPIVVPDLREQREILLRIDHHSAERELAREARCLREASATLRQSILSAAFRGELNA